MPQPRRVVVDEKVKPQYIRHLRWQACKLCPLCETRKSVVLFRGYLPCDVLFVGEAPGPSENALGFPFVGDAGILFDKLLEAAYEQAGIYCPIPPDHPPLLGKRFSLTWGITNIVACIPRQPPPGEELGSGTFREPTKEEAAACRPRLIELILVANPRLIVTLGKFANKHLPADTAAAVCNLIHPSHINRMDDERQQVKAEKLFVMDLADQLEKLK